MSENEGTSMYDDIGKKIEGLATFIFIVGLIAAVFGGFYIMSIDQDLSMIGFLVMLIGGVTSWVSSWFMYGFGELIDKVCDIEEHLRNKDNVNTVNFTLEQLERFKSLHEQGFLTDDEYQKILTE